MKIFAITLLSGLSLSASAALAQQAAPAGNIENGKKHYTSDGCYQCHGTVGQGANTGPKLGPEPLALESFISFVRNAASTNMPPYSTNLVSDAEMADIHAYLSSVSKPPARKDVPLLSNK